MKVKSKGIKKMYSKLAKANKTYKEYINKFSSEMTPAEERIKDRALHEIVLLEELLNELFGVEK